jgi:hypothetical protein
VSIASVESGGPQNVEIRLRSLKEGKAIALEESFDLGNIVRAAQCLSGPIPGARDCWVLRFRVLPEYMTCPLHSLTDASLRAVAASLRSGVLAAGMSRSEIQRTCGGA